MRRAVLADPFRDDAPSTAFQRGLSSDRTCQVAGGQPEDKPLHMRAAEPGMSPRTVSAWGRMGKSAVVQHQMAASKAHWQAAAVDGGSSSGEEALGKRWDDEEVLGHPLWHRLIRRILATQPVRCDVPRGRAPGDARVG